MSQSSRSKNLLLQNYNYFITTALLIFLFMVAVSIGKTSSESLFLDQIGENKLPLVYILTAAFIAIFSLSFSSFQIQKFGSFLTGILSFSALLVVFAFILPQKYTWVPYAMFTLYEMLFLFIQIYFWSYANDIFNPREGKKIISYLVAIGLLGSMLGGALTGIIVKYFGFENLFYFWALILLSSIPILLILRKQMEHKGIYIEGFSNHKSHEKKHNESLFATLWKIPLVRNLTYTAIPIWLVLQTIDWLFLTAISEAFEEGQVAELSTFLGLLNAVIAFVSLFLQLFVTAFILEKFGIGVSYILYAVSISVAALSLSFREIVPIGRGLYSVRNLMAVFSRFLDESMYQSIYDSSLHLLFNAIPSKFRANVRMIIHGIIEPLTIIVASLILLLLIHLEVPRLYIALGTLVGSIFWIFLASRAEKHYVNSLLETLHSNDIESEDLAGELFKFKQDEKTLNYIIDSILNMEDSVAMLFLSSLRSIKNDKFFLLLLNKIQSIETDRFVNIVDCLADLNRPELEPQILSLLYRNRQTKKSAIIRYLGKTNPKKHKDLFLSFVKSSNTYIQVEAIASYWNAQASSAKIHKNSSIYKIIKDLLNSKNKEIVLRTLQIIEVHEKKEFSSLLNLLYQNDQHEDEDIKEKIIITIGYLQDATQVKLLIDDMMIPRFTHAATRTLIRLGTLVEPELIKQIKKLKKDGTRMGVEKKENILYCFGKIGNIDSIELIFEYLRDNDLDVEYQSALALTSIVEKQAGIEETAFKNGETLGELQKNLSKTKDTENKEKIKGNVNKKSILNPTLIQNIRERYNRVVILLHQSAIYHQILKRMPSNESLILVTANLGRELKQKQELALIYLELLADDPMDIKTISSSIERGNTRNIFDAIELLDLGNEDSRRLVKVLEFLYSEQKADKYITKIDYHNNEKYSLNSILMNILVEKNIAWDCACLLYTIGDHKLKKLAFTVRTFRHSKSEIISEHAYLALDKLGYDALLEKEKYDKKKLEEVDMNMQRILFLRKISLFQNLDGNELIWLSEIIHEKKYKRHERVITEHEPGDSLFIILTGHVKILRDDYIVGTLGPGDYFGEMAILDNEPRSATVETEDNCTFLVIERDDFQKLIVSHSQITLSMFRSLSSRLRQILSNVAELQDSKNDRGKASNKSKKK